MATTKKKAETKTEFSNEELKHLEFIQNSITQISTNASNTKTTAITFIAANLLSATQNKNFALVAMVGVLMFWFLDAYYLQQARKLNGVYKDVAKLTNSNIDIKLFSAPTHLYTGGIYSYSETLMSVTLLPLYSTMIIIFLFVFSFS